MTSLDRTIKIFRYHVYLRWWGSSLAFSGTSLRVGLDRCNSEVGGHLIPRSGRGQSASPAPPPPLLAL